MNTLCSDSLVWQVFELPLSPIHMPITCWSWSCGWFVPPFFTAEVHEDTLLPVFTVNTVQYFFPCVSTEISHTCRKKHKHSSEFSHIEHSCIISTQIKIQNINSSSQALLRANAIQGPQLRATLCWLLTIPSHCTFFELVYKWNHSAYILSCLAIFIHN